MLAKQKPTAYLKHECFDNALGNTLLQMTQKGHNPLRKGRNCKKVSGQRE